MAYLHQSPGGEATDAKRRKALWGANGIAEINLPGRKEKDVLKTQEPSGLQLNIMFYGSTATGRCFSLFLSRYNCPFFFGF